jgi:hypothetical protein
MVYFSGSRVCLPPPPPKPKVKKTMKILNLNCQSIKNKPELLENLLESTKPDIVIGTESWLNPDVADSEVFPDGYKVSTARRDRCRVPKYESTPDVRGGGTFVLFKDGLSGVQVDTLETDCEISWMKLDVSMGKSVYIASFYRPHESDKHSLDELRKSLSKIPDMSNSHVWIGGDFNFPGYDWGKENIKPGCKHAEITRQFIDMLADFGLSQMVTEPTFYKNTLDLLIVNNPTLVLNNQVIPGISMDRHHAIFMECDITPIHHTQRPRKIPLYKKAD